MPVPKPHAGESQGDYMDRCMHFLTHEPGNDRSNEQCVAICLDIYRRRNEAARSPLMGSKSRLTMPLEVKSNGERIFEGYGSVFGNVDYGGDIVCAGAFTKSLDAHSRAGTFPQLFWMHDPSRVPGKWLEMREDDHGLFVKGQLADTPLGHEMHTLMKMSAVRGLSIGYMVEDDTYDKHGNRLLKEIDLWETSLVSMAMNPLAQITHAKSRVSPAGEYVPTPREWEKIFRDLGCSKVTSRRMVAKLFADNASGATLEVLESKLFGADDSGAMLEDSRCDAANAELERALDSLRDCVIAESIVTKF